MGGYSILYASGWRSWQVVLLSMFNGGCHPNTILESDQSALLGMIYLTGRV